MRKYILTPTIIMLLGSCCAKVDRLMPPQIDFRIKVPDLEIGKRDSIMYHGLGSSLIRKVFLYNSSIGSAYEVSIPLEFRYKTDSCSFVFEWHQRKDTLTIAYTKELIKYNGCFGNQSYGINFTPKEILKTTLDTIKVNYYASKNGRAISALYVTY